MAFETQAVVYGIVVPAVVAMIGCLVPLGLANRFGGWGQRACGPIGVLSGFAAAFFLFPWTRPVPSENWEWLPYLAAAAALFGTVGHARGILLPERWALYVSLAVASSWFLVPDWEHLQPPRAEQFAMLSALLVVALVLWDQITCRARRLALPWLLVLVCIAAAIVLERSGNAKLAQLAGVLAATTGAVAIVVTWRPDLPALSTAAPVIVILLCGLLYSGQIGSSTDVPLVAYILPMLAPAGLLLSGAASSTGSSGQVRLAIDVMTVVAPLVIAVLLAN